MDPALSIGIGSCSSILHLKPSIKPPPLSFPSCLHFTISKNPSFNRPIGSHIRVRASSNFSTRNGGSSLNHAIQTLQNAAASIVISAAVFGKFQYFPARAETIPTIVTEEKIDKNQEQKMEKPEDSSTPSSRFLTSNSESVESLKSLLQMEPEAGKDQHALEIVKKLVSALPEETEWKFLMERILNEMGNTQEAWDVFERILKVNPLNFEALFENALLMDRCGQGNTVILRLEEALKIAENDNKVKEGRDVRLIMAQIQFLQKNVDEALRCYEELVREDPNDPRPYFCKGIIYSLLDRNKEARDEFAKYHQLSPKKFDGEGY